jgi:hypothetical protein
MTLRNNRLQAIVDYAGANALIRIYGGSRPATGGTATTLLAQLTAGATLGTVSNAVLTLSAITQDSSADTGGTATWARIVKSDGATHVADWDVGVTGSGKELELSTTTIAATQPVSITGGTITEGNA